MRTQAVGELTRSLKGLLLVAWSLWSIARQCSSWLSSTRAWTYSYRSDDFGFSPHRHELGEFVNDRSSRWSWSSFPSFSPWLFVEGSLNIHETVPDAVYSSGSVHVAVDLDDIVSANEVDHFCNSLKGIACIGLADEFESPHHSSDVPAMTPVWYPLASAPEDAPQRGANEYLHVYAHENYRPFFSYHFQAPSFSITAPLGEVAHAEAMSNSLSKALSWLFEHLPLGVSDRNIASEGDFPELEKKDKSLKDWFAQQTDDSDSLDQSDMDLDEKDFFQEGNASLEERRRNRRGRGDEEDVGRDDKDHDDDEDDEGADRGGPLSFLRWLDRGIDLILGGFERFLGAVGISLDGDYDAVAEGEQAGGVGNDHADPENRGDQADQPLRRIHREGPQGPLGSIGRASVSRSYTSTSDDPRGKALRAAMQNAYDFYNATELDEASAAGLVIEKTWTGASMAFNFNDLPLTRRTVPIGFRGKLPIIIEKVSWDSRWHLAPLSVWRRDQSRRRGSFAHASRSSHAERSNGSRIGGELLGGDSGGVVPGESWHHGRDDSRHAARKATERSRKRSSSATNKADQDDNGVEQKSSARGRLSTRTSGIPESFGRCAFPKRGEGSVRFEPPIVMSSLFIAIDPSGHVSSAGSHKGSKGPAAGNLYRQYMQSGQGRDRGELHVVGRLKDKVSWKATVDLRLHLGEIVDVMQFVEASPHVRVDEVHFSLSSNDHLHADPLLQPLPHDRSIFAAAAMPGTTALPGAFKVISGGSGADVATALSEAFGADASAFGGIFQVFGLADIDATGGAFPGDQAVPGGGAGQATITPREFISAGNDNLQHVTIRLDEASEWQGASEGGTGGGTRRKRYTGDMDTMGGGGGPVRGAMPTNRSQTVPGMTLSEQEKWRARPLVCVAGWVANVAKPMYLLNLAEYVESVLLEKTGAADMAGYASSWSGEDVEDDEDDWCSAGADEDDAEIEFITPVVMGSGRQSTKFADGGTLLEGADSFSPSPADVVVRTDRTCIEGDAGFCDNMATENFSAIIFEHEHFRGSKGRSILEGVPVRESTFKGVLVRDVDRRSSSRELATYPLISDLPVGRGSKTLWSAAGTDASAIFDELLGEGKFGKNRPSRAHDPRPAATRRGRAVEEFLAIERDAQAFFRGMLKEGKQYYAALLRMTLLQMGETDGRILLGRDGSVVNRDRRNALSIAEVTMQDVPVEAQMYTFAEMNRRRLKFAKRFWHGTVVRHKEEVVELDGQSGLPISDFVSRLTKRWTEKTFDVLKDKGTDSSGGRTALGENEMVDQMKQMLTDVLTELMTSDLKKHTDGGGQGPDSVEIHSISQQADGGVVEHTVAAKVGEDGNPIVSVDGVPTNVAQSSAEGSSHPSSSSSEAPPNNYFQPAEEQQPDEGAGDGEIDNWRRDLRSVIGSLFAAGGAAQPVPQQQPPLAPPADRGPPAVHRQMAHLYQGGVGGGVQRDPAAPTAAIRGSAGQRGGGGASQGRVSGTPTPPPGEPPLMGAAEDGRQPGGGNGRREVEPHLAAPKGVARREPSSSLGGGGVGVKIFVFDVDLDSEEYKDALIAGILSKADSEPIVRAAFGLREEDSNSRIKFNAGDSVARSTVHEFLEILGVFTFLDDAKTSPPGGYRPIQRFSVELPDGRSLSLVIRTSGGSAGPSRTQNSGDVMHADPPINAAQGTRTLEPIVQLSAQHHGAAMESLTDKPAVVGEDLPGGAAGHLYGLAAPPENGGGDNNHENNLIHEDDVWAVGDILGPGVETIGVELETYSTPQLAEEFGHGGGAGGESVDTAGTDTAPHGPRSAVGSMSVVNGTVMLNGVENSEGDGGLMAAHIQAHEEAVARSRERSAEQHEKALQANEELRRLRQARAEENGTGGLVSEVTSEPTTVEEKTSVEMVDGKPRITTTVVRRHTTVSKTTQKVQSPEGQKESPVADQQSHVDVEGRQPTQRQQQPKDAQGALPQQMSAELQQRHMAAVEAAQKAAAELLNAAGHVLPNVVGGDDAAPVPVAADRHASESSTSSASTASSASSAEQVDNNASKAAKEHFARTLNDMVDNAKKESLDEDREKLEKMTEHARRHLLAVEAAEEARRRALGGQQ